MIFPVPTGRQPSSEAHTMKGPGHSGPTREEARLIVASTLAQNHRFVNHTFPVGRNIYLS